ncbi:MAG: hypothetical protein HGA31_05330 [Candidatus Moranbacteria bacterium]|nr:hypothetical protein [Candidatus Moranbacteria bacterium]
MKQSFEQETRSIENETSGKSPFEKRTEYAVHLSASKENVQRKLRSLKYVFAEEQYRQAERTGTSRLKFSDFVMKYTDEPGLFWELSELIRSRRNESAARIGVSSLRERFVLDLDAEYREGGLERAIEFADDFFCDIDSDLESEHRDGPKRAGQIEYGYPVLDDAGERYIPLHYPFPTKGRTGEDFGYERSLRELAKNVVEDGIYADYVRSHTWMTDKSRSERYGFRNVAIKDFDPSDGSQVWGQFVLKNGELNEKAVRYLFEHGEPREKVATDRMNLRDLIYRYYPEKRGQEVVLQVGNAVPKTEITGFMEAEARFLESYDEKEPDEIFDWMRKERVWPFVMPSEIGKDMIAFVVRSKDEGKSSEEVASSDEWKRLTAKVQNLWERYDGAVDGESVVIRIPEMSERI